MSLLKMMEFFSSHTGCTKSFATFLISHIFPPEQSTEISISFSKDALWKALQNSIKKFLLTFSDDVSISNMNDLCDGMLSQHNKNVLETFCFAIWVCSYNLCRVLHGTSFGKKLRLYRFLKLRYMQNKKSL